MSSPLEAVRSIYFSLEDKYYAFLDSIQKKVPVYSVVDPVDKVIPSFGVVLALVVAIIGFGLVGVLGGLGGGETFSLSITINDSSGEGVSDVSVSLEQNGEEIVSDTTSLSGKVLLKVRAGTYQLRVSKEGFTSLFQEIELDKSKSQIFTLSPLSSSLKPKTLVIQDSSNVVLGQITPLPILLSYACSRGTAPPNETVFNGSVIVTPPADCVGLSVTISATGYISKTQAILADTTTITMQTSAELSPETPADPVSGSVEVYVKDIQGAGVEQVQVKLYKVPAVGSTILASSSLSDPSGFVLFQDVFPGRYVVVGAKSGFKQATSVEFQVSAGEKSTQTVSLTASSTKRKVFVKVLSSASQLPIEGTTVNLFVQSASGNYIQYDTYTSDANGVVEQPLADFNGTTQLVVSHDNFVIDVSPNAGVVLEDALTPTPILLVPLSAPAPNGSISNAVVADVKTLDLLGLPVFNATAKIYTPDLNGILLGTKTTSPTGTARFSNLPAGTYQARVSSPIADGNSAKIPGAAGQIIVLPVSMDVGNALVEVTVKDEQGVPIPDANVSIISTAGNVVQSKGKTSAAGIVQLGVATGQQAFVRVEKPTYLPFSSVSFDVIKDNLHHISIEVSLTSATSGVSMSLSRVYEIAPSGAATLATTIAPGNVYAFHFSVKTPAAQQVMKSVVRVNDNVPPDHQAGDVGSIIAALSAQGAVSFFTSTNPLDEFSPSSSVNSGVPAKVSLNTIGDVNGASSFEYIVFVRVDANALANVDKLDLFFQAKSSAQTSPTYFTTYTVGAPITSQGDFAYSFFLTQQGSTNKVQITPSQPAVIEQNKNYILDYIVSNISGADFPTASIAFSSTTANSFSVIPSTPQSLPGFLKNQSVAGSVTIRSTQTCSSAVPHCSTLNVQLSNVGTGNTPTSQSLPFFTAPERQLVLTVTPSFLIPGQAQMVQAVVTDQSSFPIGVLQGVQVQGQLKDVGGTLIGSAIPFTPSTPGVFVASIPSANDGDQLEITASASGYISAAKILPVSNQVALNFVQDFSCITFTPDPVSFQISALGALTVRTQNCPEPVSLFTTGFSENGVSILLNSKYNNALITNTTPLTLNASDSKNISLNVAAPSPPKVGLYPLYVYAKFASHSTYALVKNVDVSVTKIANTTQCLDLDSYSFDLTSGSDAAAMSNVCNPQIHDSLIPSFTLNADGVYAHAVPAILTPDVANPGAPVSFNWKVEVDYNFSFDGNVAHNDFPDDPPIADGNWHRYIVKNAPAYLGNKNDFSGVTPQLIKDAAVLETYQSPFGFIGKKAILYESTLLVPSDFTMDALCIDSGDIYSLRLRVDGEYLVNGNTCVSNVKLHAGPHAFQLFAWDSDFDHYNVQIYYTKGGVTRSLSAGPGFGLSPLYGIPFNNNTQLNGHFELTGTSFVTPSVDHYLPKNVGSIASTEIETILTNAGGVDHLRRANLHVSTDNPSVRAFVEGSNVYAQFVGFDDPTATQNVVVENLGMTGEKYSIATLRDYTTLTASTTVDLGILIDASSSTLINEYARGVSPLQRAQSNGLCQELANVAKAMEHYSGVSVNVKAYFMDSPSAYSGPTTPPCKSEFGNAGISVQAYNGASPPNYDPSLDSLSESWAFAAKQFASDSFWQHATRALIIVTDNKPYGLGGGSLSDAWKGNDEQALVDAAETALNTKGIHGIILYKTPFESTSIANHGDLAKLDSLEMYESFAAQTQGFVEALDLSELITNASLANNPRAFDHASYEDVASRILQTIFPLSSQDVIVKLIGNAPNACVGENGEVGEFGDNALPRILLNWNWNGIDEALCEQNPVSQTPTFRYCDATQFTVSLTKKLFALEQAYSPAATPVQVAQIPFLTSFDAYLMRDTFNDDFRTDFTEFFANSSFSDAPSYFKNSFTGAWKDYIDPSLNRLTFEIDGQTVPSPAQAGALPSSGLYRVQIETLWDGDAGQFFVASSPSARIHVKLTRLADAQSLSNYSSFYELPLDGLVGVDDASLSFHRDGYGTAFSGNVVDLVPTPGLMLRTYPNQPGNVALNQLSVNASPDFISLNTSARGQLINFNPATGTFTLRPSLPAPVIMEWSSNAAGVGDAYYAIQESDASGQSPFVSSSQGLGNWVPLASLNTASTFGCSAANCSICLDGGNNPYFVSSLSDDNPSAATSCAINGTFGGNTGTKSFGLSSQGVGSNFAYLGAVFYRDPAKAGYSLVSACNNGISPSGRFLTYNGVASGPSVAYLDAGSLENQLSAGANFFGMLDLIRSSDTCISTASNGSTVVYWNAEKLRDDLVAKSVSSGQAFGSIANSCVAAGSPLSSSGFWTLNEEFKPIASNGQSNLQVLCPLYSSNPAAGAYYQTGLPYPVGTKIHLDTTSPPSTGDPLNSLVQYRTIPAATVPLCVPTKAGYPNCPLPSNITSSYCPSNAQRVWVPNSAQP